MRAPTLALFVVILLGLGGCGGCYIVTPGPAVYQQPLQYRIPPVQLYGGHRR